MSIITLTPHNTADLFRMNNKLIELRWIDRKVERHIEQDRRNLRRLERAQIAINNPIKSAL